MYKSCKLGMMPQKATKPKNCKKNMFKKKSARFTGSPKKALGFPKNVRSNMCTLYSARKVVQVDSAATAPLRFPTFLVVVGFISFHFSLRAFICSHFGLRAFICFHFGLLSLHFLLFLPKSLPFILTCFSSFALGLDTF